MGEKREAGVLLPVFSLPGKYGIGTMGADARRFVDFLRAAGQRYWQTLPIGPTGTGDSPYQSFSSFAGNPYFIDPEALAREGLLAPEELKSAAFRSGEYIDYGRLWETRIALLRRAFSRFGGDSSEFEKENESWLDDYALFMAEKAKRGWEPWSEWPESVRMYEEKTLERERAELEGEMRFWKFVQLEFEKQWRELRDYANVRGIKLIGDMPIYAAADSADVWSHAGMFMTDDEHNATKVAGVPPDYFSKDGQLWGNFIYDWEKMEKNGFAWWRERMRVTARRFDMARIDHFIGFARGWSVPAGEKTAERGEFIKGPGMKLIRALDETRGKTGIIAENLGLLSPEVRALIDESGYPGMAVLQFAFDGKEDNSYLPKNVNHNTIIYTGTHDNETSRGWLVSAEKNEKAALMRAAGKLCGGRAPTEKTLIRLALRSRARIAVIPMQDWLGLGDEARINTPGTSEGNWRWRMSPYAETKKLARRMKRETKESGR
ncbi:MAG: 4-alpha-glucanotransferase [Oscillospiraceae bacterium]|nr:4-alpha-glucanotransferase [Oscillospiraceae bacterium]